MLILIILFHYLFVLLKLANKLYKPKKINYKIFKKQDENELTLENEYVRKLKKIPKSCKEEYRDCFKEILYKDRILNKNNPKEIDILDERMKYLHEQFFYSLLGFIN